MIFGHILDDMKNNQLNKSLMTRQLNREFKREVLI